MVEMVHGIIAHLLPTLCPVAEAPVDMVEQENCPSEPCQPQNCVYGAGGRVDDSFKLQNFDMVYYSVIKLPQCLSCKESACQCRRHRDYRFDPWVGKVP